VDRQWVPGLQVQWQQVPPALEVSDLSYQPHGWGGIHNLLPGINGQNDGSDQTEQISVFENISGQ